MAKKKSKSTKERSRGTTLGGSNPARLPSSFDAPKPVASRKHRPRVAIKSAYSKSPDFLAWTPALMTMAVDAVWDQPNNTQASNCAAFTERPNRDCNCFVKNAVRGFFRTTQAFDKTDTDADSVVDILSDPANGWIEVPNPDGDGTLRTADAIVAFNSKGKVVIAGMKSGDLGAANGHVAVVVAGTEHAGAANLNVPMCTAGSIAAAGRVKDRGVNWSFGSSKVRQVRYFWQVPNTIPGRQKTGAPIISNNLSKK